MTTTQLGIIDRLTRRYDYHDPDFTPEVAEIVNGRLRDGPGVTYTEAHGGMWVVSRYALIRGVLKDHETFSSASGVFYPRAKGMPKHSPIDYDPPEHRVLRQLMTPPLLAEEVRGLEPQVSRLAADLIAPMIARGHGEIVAEVAKPLAIGVLAIAIGLSERAQHQVRDLTATMWKHFAKDPAKFWPAFQELLSAEVANARRDHSDTYLSRLVRMEIDGRPIPEETLHSIIVSYCIAGHETTMNTISRMLWHLGNHPDLQRRLAAEPELMSVAADETLRRWCPTDRFTRVTTRDVTIAGTDIPAGSRVVVVIDAGNRDPEKFPQPDEFSLDRGNSHQHLSFGFGIHACMGANLARLELRTVLGELARHPVFHLIEEPRRHFENGRHIVFEQVNVGFAGDRPEE
ncbi:cytochrome P450 [Dactylosporangium sp. NPDC051484]|uniref:cytochrome P450 n=1 Tax=Dactylosporangium sp. NPDC051484 TaxID=3154942 RepID=UPI00344B52DF